MIPSLAHQVVFQPLRILTLNRYDYEVIPSLAHHEYCYLTTKGRVTGKPHRIEIWFGLEGSTLYMLSGGGRDSDWVKNLIADPTVSIRIGKQTFAATARIVSDPN